MELSGGGVSMYINCRYFKKANTQDDNASAGSAAELAIYLIYKNRKIV
jgi:hypothetical protein